MMEWQPIETAPIGTTMFVAIAKGVKGPQGRPYTSDPYCVWQQEEGDFVRWPHSIFKPTHWCELPEI